MTILADETRIIEMARALTPLWSDEFLTCREVREACYARAGIALADVEQFDSEALRREQLRRKVMGKKEPEQASAA